MTRQARSSYSIGSSGATTPPAASSESLASWSRVGATSTRSGPRTTPAVPYVLSRGEWRDMGEQGPKADGRARTLDENFSGLPFSYKIVKVWDSYYWNGSCPKTEYLPSYFCKGETGPITGLIPGTIRAQGCHAEGRLTATFTLILPFTRLVPNFRKSIHRRYILIGSPSSHV